MLKIADETDYKSIYELMASKATVFDSPYDPGTYDSFIEKIHNATTTKIFLFYENSDLQGLLITRSVTHTLPAWYAHLIVIKNKTSLRISHQIQAKLYDAAINYYEQQLNLRIFFYVQPIKYEQILNSPVRRYSKKLPLYNSIVLDKLIANQKPTGSFIQSLLNNRIPVTDIWVIMKVKNDSQ